MATLIKVVNSGDKYVNSFGKEVESISFYVEVNGERLFIVPQKYDWIKFKLLAEKTEHVNIPKKKKESK